MRTPRLIAGAAFACALATLIVVLQTPATTPDVAAPLPEAAPPAAPVAPIVEAAWIDHTIAKGEVLGRILPMYGAPVNAVRDAAIEHHDLARIRAGQTLSFLKHPEEAAPRQIRYALDEDRTLVITRDESGAWTSQVDAIEYEQHVGVREFSVEHTLWGAALEAGLRPRDIASLAEVFQYDIDFNTEIRAGASARMVVVEDWREGSFARLGAPHAVRFENAGKEYVAIRFERSDGTVGYYDAQGTARKKAFLRSPLKFSRVTSGFNRNRYHPVLKKKRPHNGVDFGAPTGTAVHAVGDGRVSTARNAGGHGRFVKIDHAGPYDSSYSHLSRIAVKAGQRVRQGQVIGYVGSSGLATGPHLHYQFWVNGKYVNPLTVDLPNGEAIPRSEMAHFAATRDRWLSALDGTTGLGSNPVADATE